MLENLKVVERYEGRETADEKAAESVSHEQAGPLIAQAAFTVHKALGPGMDMRVYKECLAAEFAAQKIPFEIDVAFPVHYRNKTVDSAFTVDFLIGGHTLINVIGDAPSSVDKSKIRTFLKLSGKREAFFLNFNVTDMREGIMRAVFKKGQVPTGQKQFAKTNVTAANAE